MTAEIDSNNAHTRRLIFACVFFCFTATVNTQTFGLLLARVAGSTGLSVAATGGLRMLENVATIVIAVLLSPHVDRFPRRWPLAAGLGCGFAAALTLFAFPTAIGAAIYFWLNGMGVMLAISTATAIPSDFVSGPRLTRAMGFMIAGFSLSEVLFLPVAGRVADRYGWRSAFLLTAAILLIGAVVALIVVPGRPTARREENSLTGRYGDLLANRKLLAMLASALLRYAQYGAIGTFLSAVLIARFGISVSSIGAIFSLLGLMAFAGSASSGFFLHAGRLRLALVETGLAIGMLAGGALSLDVPLGVVITLVALIMFGLAVQENASTVAVMELSPEARGAAMSLNELSAAAGTLTGIGLGSLAIALVGTRGLGAVVMCLALGGAIVTWRVLRSDAVLLEGSTESVAAAESLSRESRP